MSRIDVNANGCIFTGLEFENHLEFRGIRYARAQRWEYPKMCDYENGCFNACEFGNCSPQYRAFEDDAVVNSFYYKEFRRSSSFSYGEDCLFLNIYAPKSAKNAPVLIYIHGGSFTGGSANEEHISGEKYAEKGVVYVNLNYRLGAFGFCSHPDVAADGACGNFGLYDQLTAIKWVEKYISFFGGNSKNITLSGQSAGAMSVDILISSPLCNGLVQKAILMSAAGLQRKTVRPLKPSLTKGFWKKVMQNANVKTMAELKNADSQTLYFAWKKACREDRLSKLCTLPVYDGKLLVRQSFNMRTIPQMTKIIGITTEDIVPAILGILAKEWIKKDSSTCYLYCFARRLPGDENGAWHASDLLYVFYTLKRNWRPFEKIDYKIADEMISAIVEFAKNGNPNCADLPRWEPGFKKAMLFCEQTKFAKLPKKLLWKNTLFNRAPKE